jgi:hypothetical protein
MLLAYMAMLKLLCCEQRNGKRQFRIQRTNSQFPDQFCILRCTSEVTEPLDSETNLPVPRHRRSLVPKD